MIQSVALREFFSRERDYCNQMVASLRHQYPQFDLPGFESFLQQLLDPFMQSLSGQPPDALNELAHAGFQHGLELAAGQWLKNPEKRHCVERLWRELYPAMSSWLLVSPRAWLAKIQNVIHHLLLASPDAPDRWIKNMQKLLTLCPTAECIESAGVVCAWLVGMAHFRNAAQDCLARFPGQIYQVLVDIAFDGEEPSPHQNDVFSQRWQVPAGAAGPLSYQGRCGGSEWLAGEFHQLPRITLHQQQVYVKAGAHYWALYADRFGRSLVPVESEQAAALEFDRAEHDFALPPELHQALFQIPQLQDIKTFSQACLTGDTLVLSSRESFAILLLGVH